MDFDFTTETITPDTTNVLTIGGSGGLELSTGTTAERPLSPVAGIVRYNSSLNKIEGYSSSDWLSLDNQGTVTSVGITPGTGISISGSPVTSTGTITVTNDGVLSLIGTTNQISVSSASGNITASIPANFIAPGTLRYTTNFGYSQSFVTATGNTQGTAVTFATTTCIITAGANGTGCILPPITFTGEIHNIRNSSGSIKYIYPSVGTSFIGSTVDTPTYINDLSNIQFVWSGTVWAILVESLAAGNSGITVTHSQGNGVVSNTGVLSFAGGSTGLTPGVPTTGLITLDGVLAINHGGTGATTVTLAFNALSPLTTLGDILYHNGTNNARLPVSSNGDVLSISTGTPAWVTQASMNVGSATTSTTATNVAGGAAGSVLYQTGAGTTEWLSAGTSSQVLVSGITPGWVSVPTALGYTPVNKAGDTMSGALNMGTNYITNLLDPVNPQDAATKQYVDNIAAGLSAQPACITSSTPASNLSAATYNNGSPAGFGATLTATLNVVLGTVGGYAGLVVNARVLVKDQANLTENGIYVVTSLGAAGVSPWILTRATNFDGNPTGATKTGDFTYVVEGTLAGTQWVLTTDVDPIIMGTDNIIFSQLSGAADYTAGSGISIGSNIVSNTGVLSNIAGAGISVSSATGNSTITNTGVTSLIAGTGITISGATGAVTVNSTATTPSTIEVNTTYTIQTLDFTVFANGATSGFTVNLPAAPFAGAQYNIKKIDQTRSTITINGNGYNIDKYADVIINVPFVSIAVQWNSTSSVWQII